MFMTGDCTDLPIHEKYFHELNLNANGNSEVLFLTYSCTVFIVLMFFKKKSSSFQ